MPLHRLFNSTKEMELQASDWDKQDPQKLVLECTSISRDLYEDVHSQYNLAQVKKREKKDE